MIWLILAILVVGYFIVKAIQRNTQVNAAIAVRNAEQKPTYNFIDTSQFTKLPAAIVKTARVPTLNKTIATYAPIMGKWVLSLQDDYNDVLQEIMIDGSDFLYNYRWEFYCETLFYAAAHITHGLSKQLTKNEQAYMFMVLCGAAMQEDPNLNLGRIETPLEHIKSLVEESNFSARTKEYLATESPEKVFKQALKTNLTMVSDDNLKKCWADIKSRIDQISFDTLLED